MYMGFTLVNQLEKRFVEQQKIAEICSSNALGLKVRPVCLQTLESIMDRGGKKQNWQLMEILTKHLQQLWVGSI